MRKLNLRESKQPAQFCSIDKSQQEGSHRDLSDYEVFTSFNLEEHGWGNGKGRRPQMHSLGGAPVPSPVILPSPSPAGTVLNQDLQLPAMLPGPCSGPAVHLVLSAYRLSVFCPDLTLQRPSRGSPIVVLAILFNTVRTGQSFSQLLFLTKYGMSLFFNKCHFISDRFKASECAGNGLQTQCAAL